MTALARYELLEASGRYFDGQTAAAREVVVKFGDASLILMTMDDMPITHWSLAGLRDRGAGNGALSLTPDDESEERLVIEDDDMVAAIRAVCPALNEKPAIPRSRKRRAIFWAVTAIASIYLIVFHLAPALSDKLATLIPPEAEAAMGEKMVRQFSELLSDGEPRFCTGGEGEQALKTLTKRLSRSANLHTPLTVRVLDNDMVNAFALPGGQIVVFRGLLRKVGGPEALAGVIAHEIGHVEARDPTRLALRAAGTAGVIGLLLGDFAGATVTVVVAETMMRSGYQREAETAADDYAARLLSAERLPTAPLADLFDKWADDDGDAPAFLEHFASHPNSGDRAAAIRGKDTIGEAPFEPALSDQDWVALRNICR